jgi:aminoglycoside phosphotransferase (APT) family kinase protein
MVGGSNRAMWSLLVRRGDREVRAVLRVDTGRGPFSGTDRTIRREASVYSALHANGACVPEILAVSPRGDAMLAEQASGASNFGLLSGSHKRVVAEELMYQLARVHQIPITDLGIPQLVRAGDDHPGYMEVATWEEYYRSRTRADDPLVRYALWWLLTNLPEPPERQVLVHGDIGPGNFMYEGRRITALLDWDQAYFGDPHDDFGSLRWRDARRPGGFGNLDELLGLYCEQANVRFDRQRFLYYQVLALVRGLVGISMGMASDDTSLRAAHIAAYLDLSRMTLQALHEANGMDFRLRQIPVTATATPRSRIYEACAANLETFVIPGLQASGGSAGADSVGLGATTFAARLAMEMVPIVRYLDAADRAAAVIEQATLTNMTGLLGSTPTNLSEGREEACRAVESGQLEPTAILRYLVGEFGCELALWGAKPPITRPLAPVRLGGE